MAKITINGEVFGWDRSLRPLAEALFVERVLGCNYAVWEDEVNARLKAGNMSTLAVILALALKRAGREVTVEDARNGTFTVAGREVDLRDVEFTTDGEDADPTSPSPEDSNTTGGATSGSSPSGSGSARGRRSS